MTGMRTRGIAALVLIVSLAACKKEGVGDSDELPADFRPHPAAGDPAKLTMPAVMASVPADTPYLFASVDAFPPELFAKVSKMMSGFSGLLSTAVQGGRGNNRLLDAMLTELGGKWSVAGLESLGVSDQPRFVIYGLGLATVVARLAVKDDKKIQATIERIAARAGEQLPPMVEMDGRRYWQDVSDGNKLVIALGDNQVVVAVGKVGDVNARLRLILGLDKPAQNMADGALLKQLMARHGLGGQLIGFGDTQRIVDQVTASAACKAELAPLTSEVPRVIYGYGEMSGAKISGGLIVELWPDAIAALRSIKVEIPGLAAALSGQPMMALAGGVDLAKAQQLAIAVAHRVQKLGTACELGPLADGADRAGRALARPLPDLASQIAGGAMIVNDLAFPSGRAAGMPSKLEGVVMVSSRDARALYDKLNALDPQIKSFAVATDGKLHGVDVPLPLPSAISAGVSERAIVVTSGEKTRATAERLLAARGGGKAPLLAASYDIGKFLSLATQNATLETAPEGDRAIAAAFDKMKEAFGHLSWALDVTNQGLAMWSTIELR